MSSVNRPCLGWDVVTEEWDEFEDMVEDKHGTATLYAGIELERAWREFRDVHPLEGYANRLLVAAGLPRIGDEKKNPSGVGSISDLETERTFVRVHEDVKAEMKQFAKSEGVPYHEVLRGVINWYREGGRDARLIEKFDRVVSDAEKAFASIEGDTGGLTKSQRLVIGIANDLDEQFSNGELREAIDRHTSGTDYYQETYAPRVIERKDVVRHPAHEDVDLSENPDATVAYMPESRAKEIRVKNIIDRLPGPDGKARPFTKRDYARAAQLELGVSYSEDPVALNDFVPRVLSELEFEWDESRERYVPVGEEADTGDEIETEAGAEAESDSAESDSKSIAAEAGAEFDRLQGATRAVTDGGTIPEAG